MLSAFYSFLSETFLVLIKLEMILNPHLETLILKDDSGSETGRNGWITSDNPH